MIPFNRPHVTGKELVYITKAHRQAQLSGDGYFTGRCHTWLQEYLECSKVLLTHSCTAALEMAAILIGIRPGDEVIMPSFTFVSTANAFVLRGGIPVFVDIRKDTLNLDETKLKGALTSKTKAIVPIHYAGVSCEIEKIKTFARKNKLLLIEDAAHCLGAKFKNKELGTFGAFGALSFHETKNIISGEGGALLINEKKYIDRAEILWQKGTNRKAYENRQVNKYSWVDIGSSFLPGEIIAAFLLAQLEKAKEINKTRKKLWQNYFELFAELEKKGKIRRPVIPPDSEHNGHLFYLLCDTEKNRNKILVALDRAGFHAVFHYVPLHSSKAGRKFGRVSGTMRNTDETSKKILRLPLWIGLKESHQHQIRDIIQAVLVQ